MPWDEAHVYPILGLEIRWRKASWWLAYTLRREIWARKYLRRWFVCLILCRIEVLGHHRWDRRVKT